MATQVDADGVVETIDIEKQSFAGIIGSITHGAVNDAATADLQALTAEMQRIARNDGGIPKGKLVISISLALEKGVFDLRADVKATYPQKAKPRAFLYATKSGGLSEQDERQHSLDLAPKDVSTEGATKIRDIGDRRKAAVNDKE